VTINLDTGAPTLVGDTGLYPIASDPETSFYVYGAAFVPVVAPEPSGVSLALLASGALALRRTRRI
jgi:hypothetical protein